MSSPLRADDAPLGTSRASEKSIGIIPGVVRATYNYGINICTDIGQRLERAMNTSPKPIAPKESVYQLKEASNMPGGWSQSLESLNAGMEFLEIFENDVGGREKLSNPGGLDGGDGGVDERLNIHGGQAAEAVEIAQIVPDATFITSIVEDFSIMSGRLPETLLHFHPFSRLPKEIRLKIWRLAATYQRIIALEFVEDIFMKELMPDNTELHHPSIRISPRCYKPPLLQVNSESYHECRKLYQMRGLLRTKYLFNPSTDVLYFSGTKHCFRALAMAFWDAQGEIPRVAIDISIPLDSCCTRLTDRIRVHRIMRVLNGVGSRSSERRFLCEGLKEVMFVLECRPLAILPTRINEGVSFRDVSTDGITKDQATLKSEFEEDIAHIMGEDPTLIDQNAWVGHDKPTFRFVNLARDKAGEAFETISTSRTAVNEIKVHYSSLAKDLQQRTGCKIILPHQKYEDGFPMEIGIKGTKGAVEVCCRKIQTVLDLRL